MADVRKTLTESGDKTDAGEKSKIEAAAKELEETLKSEDKEQIEAKTKKEAMERGTAWMLAHEKEDYEKKVAYTVKIFKPKTRFEEEEYEQETSA